MFLFVAWLSQCLAATKKPTCFVCLHCDCTGIRMTLLCTRIFTELSFYWHSLLNLLITASDKNQRRCKNGDRWLLVCTVARCHAFGATIISAYPDSKITSSFPSVHCDSSESPTPLWQDSHAVLSGWALTVPCETICKCASREMYCSPRAGLRAGTRDKNMGCNLHMALWHLSKCWSNVNGNISLLLSQHVNM